MDRRRNNTDSQQRSRVLVANGNIYETIHDAASNRPTPSPQTTTNTTKFVSAHPMDEFDSAATSWCKRVSSSTGHLSDLKASEEPLLGVHRPSTSDSQLMWLRDRDANDCESVPLLGRRTKADGEEIGCQTAIMSTTCDNYNLGEPAATLSNNFSETIKPESPYCDYKQTTTTEPEPIYARPRSAPIEGPRFVDMEMSQLIEHKRKRTLMLLRSKEAPKASIELTSPITDPDLDPISDSQSTGAKQPEERKSPACVSYYENADGSAMDDQAKQIALISTFGQQQERPSSGNSTSKETTRDEGVNNEESNTLSLVSDILGDLSQEGNSLVQQLSRDQSFNQFDG